MSRVASGPAEFKTRTYRNPALLRLAASAPHCMACFRRNDGSVVAAHSNQYRDGKGRSLKAHDFRIAFLDAGCHFAIDQGAKLTKEQRVQMWEDAHRETIGWLFLNGHIDVT
jgi:hypothetical protein